MFRIKICGITNPQDARLAAEAGADAIGLNFYPASPRCVDEATARAILDAVPESVQSVGVFVNRPVSEVAAIADRLGLDWIQLHGDEAPESVAGLGSHRVIRALPCGTGGRARVQDYLEKCAHLDALPAALLADASAGQLYGGSGHTADWNELAPPRDWLGDMPLILAGGLKPENVAAAIATVRPVAVDTASGVESSPGRKDAQRTRDFINAARSSFENCCQDSNR